MLFFHLNSGIHDSVIQIVSDFCENDRREDPLRVQMEMNKAFAKCLRFEEYADLPNDIDFYRESKYFIIL